MNEDCVPVCPEVGARAVRTGSWCLPDKGGEKGSQKGRDSFPSLFIYYEGMSWWDTRKRRKCREIWVQFSGANCLIYRHVLKGFKAFIHQLLIEFSLIASDPQVSIESRFLPSRNLRPTWHEHLINHWTNTEGGRRRDAG